jgi:aldehyde dehydrogenase (NAD+)
VSDSQSSSSRRVAEALSAARLPQTLTAVVGGEWMPVSGGTTSTVFDPGSGAPVTEFEHSGIDLVEHAVHEAHDAWPRWAAMVPAERGRIMQQCAHKILAHKEELAQLESIDTGKPLSQARGDIAVTARYLEYYAGAVDKFGGETIPQGDGTFAYTRREPYGVVAHITPWNAPVSQMMRGVAPSLAAGNAVVVKPAEVTPMTTTLVAVLLVEAGLPEGLCNVVLGQGSVVGEALVQHPLVGHITFTGSVAVGKRIGEIAASRIIGCNLELGGKSPTIVCADADLDRAAAAGAAAVVRNSGQSCFATTRLVVHRSVEQQLLEKIAERMAMMTTGHGLSDPDMGPLVSGRQRETVLGFVDEARAEGAEVVAGGTAVDDEPGYFVRPTLLANVTNSMNAARSEIFGPVQSVIAYEDLDEAIDIANDTPYGLSAGVFTKDGGRAHRIAARLQAGQVQINRYAGAGVEVPFGGYKTSGLGREKGMEALHHYSQVKSIIMDIG